MTRGISSLLLAGWLSALFVLGAARSAQAVLVFLRGQDQPVTGVLLRENTVEIVLRQRDAKGGWIERRIPRTEIVDTIQTVSRERLEALAPEKPSDYRDYAEELSEKRQDPEAQEASLRLFLIAAWLDPAALGKSSLLGMIKLARSPDEERAFRAMAYLLDPAHDRALLQEPKVAAATDEALHAGGRKLKDEERQSLIKTLQTVRSGSIASRRNLAKRSSIKTQLAPFASQLTWDEFTSAASGICSHCDKGFVKCPACDGEGKRTRAGARINCSECGGKKTVECPECEGNFATAQMSPTLLAKIIALELALRGGGGAQAKPVRESGPDEDAAAGGSSEKWSLVSGGKSTPRLLSLETLTEFDPRLCLYRDGKWIAAK